MCVYATGRPNANVLTPDALDVVAYLGLQGPKAKKRYFWGVIFCTKIAQEAPKWLQMIPKMSNLTCLGPYY